MLPILISDFIFSGTFGKILCLGHYYHQVSSTHQRLVLELTDMAESDQQSEQGDAESRAGPGGEHPGAEHNFDKGDPELSGIMKDWVLVAAGLERMFFLLYSLIFAVITSVYI